MAHEVAHGTAHEMEQAMENETKRETETPLVHWADHAAARLMDRSPDQESYVCASGISPSGVVHIGNFREVITVDFVVRSLRDRGKTVRFIYSWDDYDALRKVPKNLPNPELIEKHLRRPIGKIPDPFGTATSYARHFEELFESEIKFLGIFPHFIYQSQAYESFAYVGAVQHALAHEDSIRSILNRARTGDLEKQWTCVTIFCTQCGRDTTSVTRFTPPAHFSFRCSGCQADLEIDMSSQPGVKLLWRVDWPMRWAFEKVDFEPGGKDHSSTGGSYETGCEIVRQVFKREPPVYVQYDFVLAKGLGSKLSSSSGNLITLSQAMEVYEPQVIRWIFASRKPNIDFSISFDLDVMKAYDDFDRCERIAFGTEAADDKKRNYEARIYFFSKIDATETPATCPVQFGFRHLCNILQIHQGNLDRVAGHYGVKSTADRGRFDSRAIRAWKWISDYSPPEFRFKLRADGDGYKTTHSAVITDLIQVVRSSQNGGVDEDALTSRIFEVSKKHQLPPKAFFEVVYEALIGKKSGPKLASFILAVGLEQTAEILERSIVLQSVFSA